MSREMLNDQELEKLFEQERTENPLPNDLLARVLTDAATVQDQFEVRTTPVLSETKAKWFSWNWALPGTAMAACLCAGVFIGLSSEITEAIGLTSSTDQSFTQVMNGDGFESIFNEDQS